MKNTLIIFILNFFFFSTLAQSPSGEIDPIQKFIEVNVQIPFKARVDNVTGHVAVRIVLGNNNLPEKYEIVQNLSEECDAEALRVAKLINPKNIVDRLKGKKGITVQIPFFDRSNLVYNEGYLIGYYDQDKKPNIGDNKPEYVMRYPVDSLTGKIQGNVEYYVYEGKKLQFYDIAKLKIDSSDKHTPEIYEKESDKLKVYRVTAMNNSNFPNVSQSYFENGQIAYANFEDESYSYYPNGRVSIFTKTINDGNVKATQKIKWFANGQIASIVNKVEKQDNERFIAVWDTLGNQLLKNGEGICQLFSKEYDGSIFHTGLIKDGFKEGKWVGKDKNNETVYEENFEKGKCVKGVLFAEGQTFEYTNPEVVAEFEGGFPSFAKHLQKNLRYPVDAQKSNTQGKVFVQFIVCEDGTLCDFNVLKGIGASCDDEAVRVLQLSSGKWKPGKQRGKAVRSKFTLPVSYVLGR